MKPRALRVAEPKADIAAPAPGPAPISVNASSLPAPLRFTQSFRIGRSSDCEVIILDDFVSRIHAEVSSTPRGWQIRDLDSSNGLYLDGQRTTTIPLTGCRTIRLGAQGPQLTFEVSPEIQPDVIPEIQGDATIVARYADHYFREPEPNEALGEHTQLVRRAFAQVQAQAQTAQRKTLALRTAAFSAVSAALLLAAIMISFYAWRLHQENQHQRELARNIFYSIKALDVEIAQAEQDALAANKQHGAEVVDKYEARRRQMQENYDHILLSLHVTSPLASEQHRLIVRVANIFGECELDIPPDFEREIVRYIHLWQSSPRYAHDIQLAREKGYTRTITQALRERGLPAQFFYLALQESDFNPYATGPMTRKGYAKGMWQFIPETGVKYGLHLGPLVDQERPDPADERDQPDKATQAAARYLDMLYTTDAQASGLLVMACYNWGEGAVLPVVRAMPANPRQRNFWRLISEHRDQIPKQTYDYVFMITAAAVIGEDPRSFGFNFDNPLAPNAMEPITTRH